MLYLSAEHVSNMAAAAPTGSRYRNRGGKTFLKSFQMTVLGSRGSMAACRDDCSMYGGDTSCYMVRAGNETIFLDGGSGLASAPAVYPKAPVILLSHLHLDHIMGLGMFTGFFIPGQ